jgi:hypothetical protein
MTSCKYSMSLKALAGLALLLLTGSVLLAGLAPAQTYYGVSSIPPTAPQGSVPCRPTSGTGAWQVCQGPVLLTNYIGTTYVPAHFSTPINNSAGNVTVNSGSNLLSCSSGCNFQASEVGEPIVFYQRNTTNSQQTTILTVTDGNDVVLSANSTFSATNALAYMGTDLTSGINAAIAAAIAANMCLTIPAGAYFYNGTGVQGSSQPCIVGQGTTTSLIFLGTSSYFYDDNSYWLSAYFGKFGTFGGTGVIRNRYTGSDVTDGLFIFNQLAFRDFSGAAMSINSPDMPYQHFSNIACQGVNTVATMCLADAAVGPGTFSDNNACLSNRFCLKLGDPTAWKIENNDFIEFYVDPTNVRAAIWLVPRTGQDPDLGLTISHNKFGNENLAYQDVRILAADSAAPTSGQYIGDTLPLTTASTGDIGSIYFTENSINGGATGGSSSSLVNPIVYSYTPNIRQSRFSGQLTGVYPGYLFQFDSTVAAANNYVNHSNVCGPFLVQGFSASPFVLSNIPSYCIADDSSGDQIFSDPASLAHFASGQGPTGRKVLLNVPSSSWGINGGGGSLATINGPDGVANAVTWTMGATNGGNSYGRGLTSTPVYGANTWIELDLEQGSTGTSVASIEVTLSDSLSASRLCTKTISNLPATWNAAGQGHYKIYCQPTVAPTNTPPRVEIFSTTGTAIGQTVDIANVRIYQANEADGGGVFDNPVRTPGLIDTAEIGNAATVVGCSNSAPNVGATSGTFVSGVTGTCTVTVTMGMTANNRLYCDAYDETNYARASSVLSAAKTCTFSIPTTTGDTVSFNGAIGH